MSMTEYKVSDIIWHDDEHTSPDYYWNNRSDTFNGTTLALAGAQTITTTLNVGGVITAQAGIEIDNDDVLQQHYLEYLSSIQMLLI